jgi:2-polyprenyl-3-methyl-5-hydroxy-6-metoxy-1,4-benzoquinol methylase
MISTCYLCGSTTWKEVFVEHDVPIRKCLSCRHVFSSWEQEEHYDQFWEDEIRQPDIRFWDAAHRPVYEEFLKRFIPAQAGSLVEVGCGLGFFVSTAQKALPDWDISGYEISEAAVKWAHSKLGLGSAVHQGQVEAAKIEPRSIDAIVMWDVLEHLPRPRPLLRHLSSLLKPTGFLFLQTPNWPFQIARARATLMLDRKMVPNKDYLQPKDHVNDYSRRSLGDLAAQTGFNAPSFEILQPIMSVGGRESRIGVAAKIGLYRLSQLTWHLSRGHALINPTLFAFLHPEGPSAEPVALSSFRIPT